MGFVLRICQWNHYVLQFESGSISITKHLFDFVSGRIEFYASTIGSFEKSGSSTSKATLFKTTKFYSTIRSIFATDGSLRPNEILDYYSFSIFALIILLVCKQKCKVVLLYSHRSLAINIK